MSNAAITQILESAGRGDDGASDRLLPLVYEELRRLAAANLAREHSPQTLQPTALVHEAYLRLIGDGAATEPSWNSRGHFFGAAAQAMRRILVDRARARHSLKRGGDRERVELSDSSLANEPDPATTLAMDDLLARLEAYDATKARVVMLRYFTGLTIEQTAAALDLSPSAVKAEWAYARAWMHRELARGERP